MSTQIVKIEKSELQITDEIRELIRASIAPNTLKAYNHALTGVQSYLDGRRLTDAVLAAYITELHAEKKSPATIAQVVAAVKWRVRYSDSSMDFKLTDATLAGIRREGSGRGRGQVDGLIWQDVERVASFCEAEKTLAGLRDAAMIRLMSDCLLRISEVVAVDVADFVKKTLILQRSKTDQSGEGVALYVTSQTRKVLRAYQKKADIAEGALFRRIRRGDRVQVSRLTADAARRIIKARARTAGVEGFISGHSLRVGSAVSLAQAGATVVDMQVAGRWKSTQMPAHYAKAELAERGAIARFKEGKR